MKRLIIATFLIFLAVVAGILLIRNKKPDTNITAQTTRVGVLLPGACEDGSFCQTHYDALNAVKDELNLEIIYREFVPEDETCYHTILELVEGERCDVIIAASFGYGEFEAAVADMYPKVCFLYATGTRNRSNMASYMGRMYQARYLSGIVAGMRTETGEIGYVAAFPISEVIRGINAFTLGVHSVRPDAVIHVEYCNSWIDDAGAGKASRDLFKKYPIDVVAMHTNSLQPHIEAEKRGIWSVGYNMDNASKFPNGYLTACEWRWETYYHDQILSYLQGKFHGTHVWISMEDGALGLSPLTDNVVEGTAEAVKKAKARLTSRTFDVFYGPVIDNKGKVRVQEGESMSDNEMLNHFDWYVEGVYVEE